MNRATLNQINGLTDERHKLTLRIYTFVYIIGLLGATTSIMSNPLSTTFEKMKQILPLALVVACSLGIIFLLYKNVSRLKWIDTGIFLMTISLYFLIIAISIGKILSVIIWIPMFTVFLLALLKQRYSYLFIGIHLLVIIFYNLRYPAYHYEVTRSTYASMYTIVLVLFISVPKIVKLIQRYQQSVLENVEVLSDQNEQINKLLLENNSKNEQLMEIAYHDSVTGLLNRQGFINMLDQELNDNPQQQIIVLLIDIVQFRNINGVYGYGFGDKLLCAMANRLSDPIFHNKFISRVGNDTFATVLNNTCIQELKELLDNQWSGSFNFKEHDIHVKYIIGIATCHQEKKTADQLLIEADIALGKIKKQSMNKYFIYDAQIDEEISNRFNMMLALERAVEGKKIYVMYQPIYDARIEKIVSFEALARWNDEIMGNISPELFISLAEKSALIFDLGEAIIGLVCRFAKKLFDDGYRYTITINISYRQLEMEDFADGFIELLRNYGVDPRFIGIEITESVFIDNFDLVIRHLNRLRTEGVKIYLDDFGTGYSSLNYLDQLPIDTLKIDKTFVDEILVNERKQKMLENISNLASDFNLNMLAEGVETKEQSVWLVQTKIPLLQGYYFSKPLTEQALYKII